MERRGGRAEVGKVKDGMAEHPQAHVSGPLPPYRSISPLWVSEVSHTQAIPCPTPKPLHPMEPLHGHPLHPP